LRLIQASSRTRESLALILLLLFTSCVGFDIKNWPVSIPQPEIFSEIYFIDKENQHRQSEEEYLGWVLRFYQGNLTYQSGWIDIQGYIYEASDPVQNELLLDNLSVLGTVIGSEWAKHNDVRLIDTRMLSLWGTSIQLAADFTEQKEIVELIAEDVDLLLTGLLGQSDIFEARYFDILGLEPFADF
jgi:hypothetical protein